MISRKKGIFGVLFKMHMPLMPFFHSLEQDMVQWLWMDLGWQEMARETGLVCFQNNPSINSSLKVLALHLLS